MSKPWILQVDWTCHHAYGTKVEVRLHVKGEHGRIVAREATITSAVDKAIRFFESRGFGFTCDVDWHQRSNHKYITMHPAPAGVRSPHTPAR